MRIDTLRISGFRCLPFCAKYQETNNLIQVSWDHDAFRLALPTDQEMVAAMIGPNSSGKSSILYALDAFFGSATKLKSSCFHQQDETQPVIVEITFKGTVANPDVWHQANCVKYDESYQLTIVNVWKDGGRSTLIRRADGECRKANAIDKKQYSPLLPEYRLIPADSKLVDEANPEKKNLLTDLINELLQRSQSGPNNSVVHEIQNLITQLKELADRSSPNPGFDWREIEALERSLSKGIASLTPSSPQVRLHVSSALPTLDQIFLKGRIHIDDGIELAFEEHGLGLQRSFVVSTLSTWCEYLGTKNDSQDYVFGFEEPELFLHPHATRLLLGLLRQIGRQDQVLFTSHSPEFVNQVNLDNVISVRRDSMQRRFIRPDLSLLDAKQKAKVQRYLQEDRSDMLFARAVLLVEGQGELFAIPAFADTIDCHLDMYGASVVFVNGKGNFETYHQILEAFCIPHVIMMDGDGNRNATILKYQPLATGIYVLEEDFEHLLVSALDEKRLLEILKECRTRRGRFEQQELPSSALSAINLKSQWWEELKDALRHDIAGQHRAAYEEQKQQLELMLEDLAKKVIDAGHTTAASADRRRALMLKKEGKPLVGRVVGEMLSRDEVERMQAVVSAIKHTVQLAQAGLSGT